jgi:ribosomal-protein-alanine N-acetyltransferase
MNLPPYKIFPELESEGIFMREILPADLEDVFEISYFDAKPAATLEEAAEMMQKINEEYQNGSTVNWGIADKETNIIMGTCGFHHGFENENGEVGCVMRPAYRGKGYMTTAIKLAVDFGINKMGLNKVIAITTQGNEKAIGLLGRLNFVKIKELEGDAVEYHYKH